MGNPLRLPSSLAAVWCEGKDHLRAASATRQEARYATIYLGTLKGFPLPPAMLRHAQRWQSRRAPRAHIGQPHTPGLSLVICPGAVEYCRSFIGIGLMATLIETLMSV